MAMGRPREHDRNKIAEDMIIWAAKEDSLNLNGFCAEQLIDPSKITNWAKEDDNFRQAYNISKSILAHRREKGLINGTLHVKAYDLNANVYDRFLKEERTSQAREDNELKMRLLDYMAAIKAKEGDNVPEDIKKAYNDLMDQIVKSKKL